MEEQQAEEFCGGVEGKLEENRVEGEVLGIGCGEEGDGKAGEAAAGEYDKCGGAVRLVGRLVKESIFHF